MPNPISKLLSLGDGKRLRRYRRTVDEINSLEDGLSALEDAELRAAADHLRERATAGEANEKLLPESFALMREAAKRTVGLRHYDVQLIGGMALNDGCVAEMKYGTNSEFGFDYLRDNMVSTPADCVQRGHAFAVVDEADSVLIDEAGIGLRAYGHRDPLVEYKEEAYRAFSRLVDSIYEDSLRAVLRLPAGGSGASSGGLSGEDDPFRPEGMMYSDSRSAPGAPPLEAPDPAGGNPLG